MTVIEFFDEEKIDNIMGTLLLRPERVVFLLPEEKDKSFFSALDAILKKRNIKTEVICEFVDASCVEAAQAKIESVAKKYGDCEFDISGGNDIMLVAMGQAAKSLDVPMHCVNVTEKKVTSVNKNKSYKTFDVSLDVEELVGIHGGKCGREATVKAAYTWERDVECEADIEKVWDICRKDTGAWNSAVGAMKAHKGENRNVAAIVWSKLKKERLVYNDGSGMKYKNDIVKYLLQKQGNALEMFTFITAKSAEAFDDGQSGVVIDWKGRREVENEIDVLLTKGAVGYFVSCKNGMVESEELYKLNTVAKRFGGKYAKKILVISRFEPDRSFMERAQEMGIKVIKNVRYLSKKDFASRLVKN